MAIKSKLEEVFASKVKGAKFDENANLSDLGLDSLDKIELLYDIEDAFGIQFENDEMQNFVTAKDVKDAIEQKIK